MLSRCITPVRSLVKIAVVLGSIALAATSATPAFAFSGPFQVLYLFAGLTDFGGPTANGVATVIHCFSFSPGQDEIQYVVRNSSGELVVTVTTVINQFQTVTIVTHSTNLYVASVAATGDVREGTVGITATSSNIVCTAQVVDASATVPNGIELHGTRFNPITGTQE